VVFDVVVVAVAVLASQEALRRGRRFFVPPRPLSGLKEGAPASQGGAGGLAGRSPYARVRACEPRQALPPPKSKRPLTQREALGLVLAADGLVGLQQLPLHAAAGAAAGGRVGGWLRV
jgi:hypothetical protein